MIIIKDEKLIPNKKDKELKMIEIEITNHGDETRPMVQIVKDTRVRKYRGSNNDLPPSREIRKWFEARRF
jgi:hypothetical protein